jgi:hypothetical protein
MVNGVIYVWNTYNKINGSLFYAYEYSLCSGVPLYIIKINSEDLHKVKIIFDEKYKLGVTGNIITIDSRTQLYKMNISVLFFVDVKSFTYAREFVPENSTSLVYSDRVHDNFRYTLSNRKVIYYGAYTDYQIFDIRYDIKLYFDGMMSKGKLSKNAEDYEYTSFISFLPQYTNKDELPKEVLLGNPYIKSKDKGIGNILEKTNILVYIHNQLDTNNRIIPEFAYYHGLDSISMINNKPELIDSTTLRYNDIKAGNLNNYILNRDDEIICQLRT